MDKDGYHGYDKPFMKVEGLLHVVCQCDKCKTQPHQKWVGLTDEEIIDVIHPLVMADMPDQATDYDLARAIEAKLKEKNGWYRQHVIDGSPCWCEPETSYTDPETGASVVVHKEPQ